jgi:hypothetical protein
LGVVLVVLLRPQWLPAGLRQRTSALTHRSPSLPNEAAS